MIVYASLAIMTSVALTVTVTASPGNKGIAARSYVRFRLYYDKFNNLLKAYDNATYTMQSLASSFTSPFDDDIYGTSIEIGTRARLCLARP